MTSEWSFVIAIFAITALTTGGGLFIAHRKPKWYTQSRICFLVAFGAGVLLGISFFEFIPHSFEHEMKLTPVIILSGLLFMLFTEAYITPKLSFLDGDQCDHDHAKGHDHKSHTEFEHAHHLISHQAACSAVGCLLVCAFFDGFEIRSAFLIDASTGWFTSLGLLFHILPDGVLAASIAIAGGLSQNRAKLVSWVTGGAIIMGTIVASLMSQWAPPYMLLPFAAGVLIYVTLIHLLPLGMKHKWGLVGVLLGAGLISVNHFLIH